MKRVYVNEDCVKELFQKWANDALRNEEDFDNEGYKNPADFAESCTKYFFENIKPLNDKIVIDGKSLVGVLKNIENNKDYAV